MANYIVIDADSAKVQDALKTGGAVDQNTAFRQKWNGVEMTETGGQLIFSLGKIKYIIDVDGTVIIEKPKD